MRRGAADARRPADGFVFLCRPGSGLSLTYSQYFSPAVSEGRAIWQVDIQFRRASRPAGFTGKNLEPGTCGWANRAMKWSEPNALFMGSLNPTTYRLSLTYRAGRVEVRSEFLGSGVWMFTAVPGSSKLGATPLGRLGLARGSGSLQHVALRGPDLVPTHVVPGELVCRRLCELRSCEGYTFDPSSRKCTTKRQITGIDSGVFGALTGIR